MYLQRQLTVTTGAVLSLTLGEEGESVVNIKQFLSAPHPYVLPQFLNAFSWSVPFAVDNSMHCCSVVTLRCLLLLLLSVVVVVAAAVDVSDLFALILCY